MKWQEIIETNKKKLVLAFLPFLLIGLIVMLRTCDSQDSNISNNSEETSAYEDATKVPSVTYIITMSDPDKEPVSVSLDVSSDGRAVIPFDGGDVENVVWSGWVTEEGKMFDFSTIVKQDITLYCTFWPDENNNNIVDGSKSDPITVYQFQQANGVVLFSKKLFGHDVEFDYQAPEYAFPQSEDDGYIFLGWVENTSVSEDGGIVTVVLRPKIASDRNNNDIIDGSADDPYIYHVFLAQDGTVLKKLKWLSGDVEITGDDIHCPTTTNQKLVGWHRTESKNEEGNVVYTYTPIIE